jgi:hypothetical protein
MEVRCYYGVEYRGRITGVGLDLLTCRFALGRSEICALPGVMSLGAGGR